MEKIKKISELKKWFEAISLVGLCSFALVFLFKMLVNNDKCITIMEPVQWIRGIELIYFIVVIIFMLPKLLREVLDLEVINKFTKGGKK